MIISLFYTFIVIYRKSIFEDWRMVLLISIVFFLQVASAHIVLIQLELSEYLIPFTVGAMTLTILFDARMGFMATTSMAIMMGIMMGMMGTMMGLILGVMGMRKRLEQVQRPGQLFSPVTFEDGF